MFSSGLQLFLVAIFLLLFLLQIGFLHLTFLTGSPLQCYHLRTVSCYGKVQEITNKSLILNLMEICSKERNSGSTMREKQQKKKKKIIKLNKYFNRPWLWSLYLFVFQFSIFTLAPLSACTSWLQWICPYMVCCYWWLWHEHALETHLEKHTHAHTHTAGGSFDGLLPVSTHSVHLKYIYLPTYSAAGASSTQT